MCSTDAPITMEAGTWRLESRFSRAISKTAQHQVIFCASDVGLGRLWKLLGSHSSVAIHRFLQRAQPFQRSLMDGLATAVPIAQTSNSPLPLALVVRDDR